MANKNETKIVITAQDQTRTGVDSAKANINTLTALAAPLQNALGALGVGVAANYLVDFTKGTIDAADRLNDLSQSMGLNLRELSKYQLAAAQSGTSLESIGKGIKGMATNLAEHGDALRGAGVTAKTADGALRQVADIFAQMPDGLEKTTLAVKLFGKSGMDLIPMLNMGSAGLAAAAEKSAQYAAVMETLAPQADKFNDTLAELSMASKVASLSMVSGMLPSLTNIAAAMAAAAHESGTLKAAWVGFGGIGWEAVFKPLTALALGATNAVDELILKLQKLAGASQRSIVERAGMIEARNNQIAGLKTDSPADGGPKAFDEAAWKAKYKELLASLGGGGGGKIDDSAAKERARLMALAEKGDIDALVAREKAWRDAENSANEYRNSVIDANAAETKSMLAMQEKGDIEALIAREKAWREEQEAILDAKNAVAETNDIARELGMTFGSAFEDAIVSGNSFRDVLKGIGMDISRIIARETITKPLAAGISDFAKTLDFKKLFSGSGSSSGADGWTSGSDLPLGSYATGTDYVPQTGLYQLHQGEKVIPANQNARSGPVFNVDMRGASVDAVQRLEQLVASVNGSIERRALNVMSQARVRGAG